MRGQMAGGAVSKMARVVFVAMLLFVGITTALDDACHPCTCTGKTMDTLNCNHRNLNSIPAFPATLATQINKLYFIGNHLENVGESAFNLFPSLTEIVLRSSNISLVHENAFVGLVNLHTLDLSRNHIKVIEPDVFASLETLHSLDLSNNPITLEGINHALTPRLASLQTLDVSNLGIRTENIKRTLILPPNFSLLTNLTELRLWSYKKTKWTFTNDSFSAIENIQLKSLGLRNCHIIATEPGAFSSLRHLAQLDINSVKVTAETLTGIFHDLSDSPLRYLNLQYAFQDPDNDKCTLNKHVFEGLSNVSLEILHMEGNYGGLKGALHNNFFHYLHSLRYLYLNDSDVGSITQSAFKGLKNLEFLSLKGNTLTCVSDDSCAFLSGSPLKSLRTLDLSANSMQTVSSEMAISAKTFPSLEYLDLSDNRMHILDDIEFEGEIFQNLKHLDLSKNPIENMKWSHDGKNVKYIFANMPKLHVLKITDTFITTLVNNSFHGLERLHQLDLSSNRISSIEDGAFEGLTHLQGLWLRGNSLRHNLDHVRIPSVNLTVLDLGSNRLDWLPHDLVARQPKLTTLLLDDNKLGHLSAEQCGSLKHVTVLNVSNNDIVIPDTDTLQLLVNLRTLDFSHNPFLCDCRISEFVTWLEEHNVTQNGSGDSYTCAAPAALARTSIYITHPSRLSCRSDKKVLILGGIFVFCVLVLLFISCRLVWRRRCGSRSAGFQAAQPLDATSGASGLLPNGDIVHTPETDRPRLCELFKRCFRSGRKRTEQLIGAHSNQMYNEFDDDNLDTTGDNTV